MTLAETAYSELKKLVLSGELSADRPLTERDVAERLGMSRTPVREALRRLESERLLTIDPRRGVMAVSLDQTEIADLYFMREVLEGTAARLAAQHATLTEIRNLESILEEEAQALHAGGDMVAINLALHEAIYQAAHSKFLVRALQSLTDSTFLLGRSTLVDPQRAASAHAEHVVLVDAIRARNGDQADEAARTHIRAAHFERMRILREQRKPKKQL
jgi:DNA-binding GntR family transcriptional regulator